MYVYIICCYSFIYSYIPSAFRFLPGAARGAPAPALNKHNVYMHVPGAPPVRVGRPLRRPRSPFGDYVYTYVINACVYTNTCIYTYTHVYIHICIYAYTYMSTHDICVYTCVCVCVCVCIPYIHTYTYITTMASGGVLPSRKCSERRSRRAHFKARCINVNARSLPTADSVHRLAQKPPGRRAWQVYPGESLV